ncbi:MAG: amino acid adenylation domain-containing protein, partial [Candidatus Methylumidiphilus sp.]
SDASLPEALQAQPLPGVTVLTVAAEFGADDPGEPSTLAQPADALSYVMYTSGSTGTPKGIAITQRDVVELALAPCWQGGNHSRVLLHSPPAFDASTYELWVPLLNGGQIIVAPAGELDVQILAQAIRRERVTALWLTSALFNLLAEEDLSAFAELAEIWVGGEAVSAATVQRVRQACPGLVIVNGYGPTETTTFATFHKLPTSQPIAGTVPIGKPMAGMRAYVLDDGLQPVPVGVAGELYLAGAGLARGYVGLPGLSAERFVADPFGGLFGVSGTRMYRTGDRVLWNAQGEIEFVGRADSQVKIRGFRIEPGEIEALLSSHEAVAQAAVIVREDRPGDKRLVAYAVAAAGSAPESAALRDWLKQRLPDYMVPAAIVALDALPLNQHGKLDRKALPAPDLALAVSERTPRTLREQQLCVLFAEALNLPSVGVDDDFFALGGHSLLAARLVSRLRAAFGIDIGLRALFEASTPFSLARHMDLQVEPTDTLAPVFPLRVQGERPPLFCVHPGGGTGWCYAGLLRHLPANRPVIAVQARSLADPAHPRPASIAEMAADYADLLIEAYPDGPYNLLGWSVGGTIAHAVAVELRQRGREVGLLAIMDSYPMVGITLEENVVPTEQEMLAQLAGLNPAEVDETLTPAHVLERLRTRGDSLADLGERQIAAAVAVMINNSSIMMPHVPAHFDGGVLFFRATAGQNPQLIPTLWRPYVAGDIEVHSLDCRHDHMDQPGPLSLIGPLLAARLDDPAF